jgi:hypothetical protein
MKTIIALAVLLALPAWADNRPGMDDFYARTRGRHEGFSDCLIGLCDGARLLQLLVGAQMANPSTDALQPALAEGLRLGLDTGIRGGYAVARARGWADLLWVNATGERLTEYVGQVTGFMTTAPPGGLGVHLSTDVQVAARTELEPQDFAEFQANPYTVLDAEGELAIVGPKVDKEGFLVLPFGYAHRLRWRDVDGGARTEQRRTLSAAAALRAFQKKNRFHYQLEAARLTRVDWSVPAGEASAWKAQFGYQRLSPDIPGVQLWLLFGWAWVDGAEDDHGFITRVGVDVDFMDIDGGVNVPHVVSAQYQRDFALDRRTRQFRHLNQLRLYHGTTAWDPVRVGLAYELASVAEVGALHVIEPEVAWRPFDDLDVEVGVRFRIRVRSDEAADAAIPDGERFQLNLDWLL